MVKRRSCNFCGQLVPEKDCRWVPIKRHESATLISALASSMDSFELCKGLFKLAAFKRLKICHRHFVEAVSEVRTFMWQTTFTRQQFWAGTVHGSRNDAGGLQVLESWEFPIRSCRTWRYSWFPPGPAKRMCTRVRCKNNAFEKAEQWQLLITAPHIEGVSDYCTPSSELYAGFYDQVLHCIWLGSRNKKQ